MMDPARRSELLNMDDEALWAECAADFRRGTGNGGQKLNKTSSAVRIFHAETGITVNCMETRSQSLNRHIALKKLRLRIAAAVRCPVIGAFLLEPIPSISGKGYAAWTARLFDSIADAGWDLKAAAVRLGTSRSKLTKTLQRDPSLWREYLYASSRSPENENEPD